jgi:hypothetical protein
MDVCVHISNPRTGPDTLLIGYVNTIEYWIANDEELLGMSLGFEFEILADFTWFGPNMVLFEWNGRAVGALDGPYFGNDFDDVSPEHACFGGAGLSTPLPAGPSEPLYLMHLFIEETASPMDTALIVRPYFFPPSCIWQATASTSFPPNFCSAVVEDPYDPVAPPVAFPLVAPEYLCGDANADGILNITDAVYLVYYIFGGGPEPQPYNSGDLNCDDQANISDAVFLIRIILNPGYDACDPDNDNLPECR